MTIIQHVLAIVLGLVFGSFATVLAARVPGMEHIGGRSQCRSCGAEVLARDNIPVLSWTLLRGRCRRCGHVIGWRYPVMELATAVLFLLIVLHGQSALSTIAWLLFTPLAVALVFIDLEHKRLPDALTLPAFLGALVLLGVDAAIEGDWSALWRSTLAGLILSGFYLLLNVVSRGGMGMGDVKLALSLGALLGHSGWPHVIAGTFVAFILGSVVGVALMLLGRAGRKSALPFGPFMVFGAYVAYLTTPAISDWLIAG